MNLALNFRASAPLILLVGLIVSFPTFALPPPESNLQTAKLTINTTVIANDLSVKIVPKLALSIEPEAGALTLVSSSLEGNLTIDILPGKYRVKSTRGVESSEGKKQT